MKELVQIKELRKHFEIKSGSFKGKDVILKAVDNVSFSVNENETLGIVGESGCGKSTLAKCILRLHNITEGKIIFDGIDISSLKNKEMKALRKRMQMIFQDPFSSLNPRKKISKIVSQPLLIHNYGNKNLINDALDNLLNEVGLDPKYKNRYPHQFSGGQRQRIGIARAIALNPELIICDEAVSALDVSIQAQILNLLKELQDKYNLTYLFIAHDLSVVEFVSTRIIVMYLGRIVEMAEKKELVSHHIHPYTKILFEASPTIDPRDRTKKEEVVLGDVPSPINPPKGCHFHPRCPRKIKICESEYPELKDKGNKHFAACHNPYE